MTTAMQHFRHDYIEPPFDEATVMDVMHPGVLSCHPGATVRDAARAMSDHGMHALVVEGISRDASGHSHLHWGVFSDMDLVRAAAAGKLDAQVGDEASAEAATVEPGAPLRDVARLMEQHRISHVIVVHGGRPTGVVSSADLARAVAWSRA